MPLPLPRLDRRTFAELVEEGRSLLPLAGSPWTDHNASDPGITLLELFASIIERASYRLDRTPPAALRAFLRLVGVEPHPARVAETVLSLHVAGGGTAAVTLPAGLQLQDASGTVVFQTAAALTVSPARLAALSAGPEDALVDRLAENTSGGGYQPFGPSGLGTVLYLGFDGPLADAPATLALFVWTGAADVDSGLRSRLIAEGQAAHDELSCPPGVAPDMTDWRLHHSARTAWEYLSSSGRWRPLPDVLDETRGLTLSGFVRFSAPLDHVPGGPAPGRYFLRCRHVAGGYECPPSIAKVLFNAVLARHAADMPGDALGESTGTADQRVALPHRNVVAGSTRLWVHPDGGGSVKPWTEKLDWDHTGPHDRHYVLAPDEGELIFGDGLTGRVPPAGAALRANYQVGGGPSGNLSAGTLDRWRPSAHNATLVPHWSVVAPTLRVTQPVPAVGGDAAETLDEAQGRALDTLAARERAVTLEDLEALALAAPGLPVARAHALAERHPALACVPAHGCVTVVVVPACPGTRPVAGPDLLLAVQRHLERRRSLTMELHVVGPRFAEVSVSARLLSSPPSQPTELQAAARQALNRFFHPLHGGPEGQGWPFGRHVYEADVFARLSAIPGIMAVDRLSLRLQGSQESGCDHLTICPDTLLTSGDHQIQVVERSSP